MRSLNSTQRVNKKLRYPRSTEEMINSIDSFTQHYKYQFGLVTEQLDNNKYHYKVYAFGFDNDDDKLTKVYNLSLKNILIPFIDGDILIDEDTLFIENLSFLYVDKKGIYEFDRYNIPDSLVQILKPFD